MFTTFAMKMFQCDEKFLKAIIVRNIDSNK